MYHKPKKMLNRSTRPIKTESDSARRKRIATYKKWIIANPGDENETWTCYLQISVLCPKTLTRPQLTLEHVKSKVRHPDLRYDPDNIRASCSFCNKLKGSRELEELARIWPHLIKYLS